MGTLKFDARQGSTARTLTMRTPTVARPSAMQGVGANAGASAPTPIGAPMARPLAMPRTASSPAFPHPTDRALTPFPLTTTSGAAERRAFRRGEAVVVPGARFLRVERGTVAFYRILPGRRSICVALLRPGDYFAVPAANERTDALTEVHVTGLEQAALMRLVATSPEVADALITSLADRIAHAERLLQRVLGRDIAVRLGGMLCDLAITCGQPAADGMTAIAVSMPHKLLARMIGGNRVTVTRVMAELRDANLVVSPRRNRILVDLPALQAYVERRESEG